MERRRPPAAPSGALDALLASADEGPAVDAERRDLRRRAGQELPALIAQLPPQQACTMQLVWESATWPPDYDLLCARLGINRPAARKRVHDALRNLRALSTRAGFDQEVSP